MLEQLLMLRMLQTIDFPVIYLWSLIIMLWAMSFFAGIMYGEYLRNKNQDEKGVKK